MKKIGNNEGMDIKIEMIKKPKEPIDSRITIPVSRDLKDRLDQYKHQGIDINAMARNLFKAMIEKLQSEST